LKNSKKKLALHPRRRIYTKMLRAEDAYLAETRKHAVDPRVSPQPAAQIDAIRAAHAEARDALQELVKLLPPVADEATPSTTISPSGATSAQRKRSAGII
jgi:type II secretory pathway component PulC